MKEFLLKKECGGYDYLQSNASVAGFGEYYEIPKGAEIACDWCNDCDFYKLDGDLIYAFEDGNWGLCDFNKDYLFQNVRNILWQREKVEVDNVNHPKHYTGHPSGIECIEITRHHDFAIGNAIKYLWRAGLKDSDNEIQDLEKAVWYIQDKIKQLKG